MTEKFTLRTDSDHKEFSLIQTINADISYDDQLMIWIEEDFRDKKDKSKNEIKRVQMDISNTNDVRNLIKYLQQAINDVDIQYEYKYEYEDKFQDNLTEKITYEIVDMECGLYQILVVNHKQKTKKTKWVGEDFFNKMEFCRKLSK